MGGELKAGSSIHWNRKAAIVGPWKYKKRDSVATCQAKKVIGSSFTPSVALLVHPSGTVHPTMDCHGLTRS